jgi:hypothetical protein
MNKSLKSLMQKTVETVTKVLEADQMSLKDRVGEAIYQSVNDDEATQSLLRLTAQKCESSPLLLAPMVDDNLVVTVWKLVVAKSSKVVLEVPTLAEATEYLLTTALGRGNPAFIAQVKAAQ